MILVSLFRYVRRCLALFFEGAALIVGCNGVLLFVEPFVGHWSTMGNFQLIGLGLFLLGLSLTALIVGGSMWRLARPTRAAGPQLSRGLMNGPFRAWPKRTLGRSTLPLVQSVGRLWDCCYNEASWIDR